MTKPTDVIAWGTANGKSIMACGTSAPILYDSYANIAACHARIAANTVMRKKASMRNIAFDLAG